jgi:hypothetical protein
MLQSSSIAHASTKDGQTLPVIDVTHPGFAIRDDEDARATLLERYVEAESKQARTPKILMRLMMKMAARKSLLLRAVTYPEDSFLGGLSTYVMKLGEQNLVPPFDTEVDKRMAASPHLFSMRLRLQQCATLLADGLRPRLAEDTRVPLLMINIGGGPAMDSLNALILLRAGRSDLLSRSIQIRVLDLDDDGPAFGANALAALTTSGGPLEGLDVSFEQMRYDWNDPSLLHDIVSESERRGQVLAASSEGALFEYGSDEAIFANLTALRPRACVVVGSVTRADALRLRSIRTTGFALVPRGLECFTHLAEEAGFRVARVEETPLSDQLLLIPALQPGGIPG